MIKLRKNKRGYTLVELMVVVTIMIILATASTPVFTGYVKKAKTSEYLSGCRAVYMAAESYFIEYSGRNSEDIDPEHLVEEIEFLTSFDVEILENTDAELKSQYGILISDSASGRWTCDAVVCTIDDDQWIFSTESGEFAELK